MTHQVIILYHQLCICTRHYCNLTKNKMMHVFMHHLAGCIFYLAKQQIDFTESLECCRVSYVLRGSSSAVMKSGSSTGQTIEMLQRHSGTPLSCSYCCNKKPEVSEESIQFIKYSKNKLCQPFHSCKVTNWNQDKIN